MNHATVIRGGDRHIPERLQPYAAIRYGEGGGKGSKQGNAVRDGSS